MSVIEEESARRRATITDVARFANVSTATVDRVLNGRAGVKALTTRRVMQAAAELGYVDESDERAREVVPKGQIVFLLPEGTNRYLTQLGRQITEMAPHFERQSLRATVEHIRSFNPELLAKALQKHAKTAAGIAFMGIEHPVVREAVTRIGAAGVPVITLISDVASPGRTAYLGLDNRAAGRMAAYLLARFITRRPAKVAMIAGSLGYRAHGEREMGFLDLLQEEHPGIEVVGLREGHDDEALNHRQMRMLLSQHPDLAGIYNIGGGASGVGRALKDARREREIVFVGHGLTPDTREYLVDGTMDAVITQSAEDTVRRCVAIFADVRAGRPVEAATATMRIEVVFRENLP
ncbi:LacI family DNA-binding transcriptional regulator [Aureimonas sp. AU22]|uniref:LacI family DNA-binding transcriptional regulator n=1 Tax=Aureimonas sp. AU22 TaxID=1638162 RepID=UPI0007060268|nr:LacI family DNA-binding transcriptional regulator [Aureimonas sp. AU22]BAT29865.1 regulatory protein [Aureimonas sp. AU22]